MTTRRRQDAARRSREPKTAGGLTASSNIVKHVRAGTLPPLAVMARERLPTPR